MHKTYFNNTSNKTTTRSNKMTTRSNNKIINNNNKNKTNNNNKTLQMILIIRSYKKEYHVTI